jgi:uncharacterized protein YdeI (BOF family)
MRYIVPIFFSLIITSQCYANWGMEVMSADAVRHWRVCEHMVHVRGKITEVFGAEGFTLADDTGDIQVRLTNRELIDFGYHKGMYVEVRGRIDKGHRQWDLDATGIKLHDDAILGYH